MPSTSVHLSPELLDRLDRVAKRAGSSRNRVIVKACQAWVDQAHGTWPENFFSNDDLSPKDIRELRRSLDEWPQQLTAARVSKTRAPF